MPSAFTLPMWSIPDSKLHWTAYPFISHKPSSFQLQLQILSGTTNAIHIYRWYWWLPVISSPTLAYNVRLEQKPNNPLTQNGTRKFSDIKHNQVIITWKKKKTTKIWNKAYLNMPKPAHTTALGSATFALAHPLLTSPSTNNNAKYNKCP